MKIDLTELLRQVGNEADISFEEGVSFPEDGLVLTRPVRVEVHLTNTGSSVLVNGRIRSEAELECSRCLKKFRVPLEAAFTEDYAKELPVPTGGEKRGRELKEGDFVYPFGKDNVLDLKEPVRQNLLLALPLKPLCSIDCPGA